MLTDQEEHWDGTAPLGLGYFQGCVSATRSLVRQMRLEHAHKCRIDWEFDLLVRASAFLGRDFSQYNVRALSPILRSC
jgi:hypothetical protein